MLVVIGEYLWVVWVFDGYLVDCGGVVELLLVFCFYLGLLWIVEVVVCE